MNDLSQINRKHHNNMPGSNDPVVFYARDRATAAVFGGFFLGWMGWIQASALSEFANKRVENVRLKHVMVRTSNLLFGASTLAFSTSMIVTSYGFFNSTRAREDRDEAKNP